ncbi:glycosyltransferase family 4 protein [Ruminococcus flavefaciens]|uniref:glycosyltransferase family 4 protein n=1 Tax=Ruminococcus flavefaciens TaxID=1265 RepID=UPI00048FDA11|nr:glycosyltransferase family 4 protein [Ruminococcus flavefaciens]
MKILFIGHEDDLNGASKSLLEIISILEKKHQIYVLTRSTKGTFYKELLKHNIKVIVMPYYRWCIVKGTCLGWLRKKAIWYFYHQFVNLITAKKISNIVKKEHIDIIHTNTSVISIGGLIHERCNVKHVWHIREFADLDFNMYPLINKKKYYHFMNNTTDCFIFNSNAVANHYTLLDKQKKVVVYNGVSSKNIIQNIEKEQHSNCNILISGRIGYAKGQKQALQACEKLIRMGITNFHLFVAGSGNIDIPSSLKSHVTLLGVVNDMPSIRKKIDFELVCSRAEAFGRVTVEAQLGGIPVIGSNTGGTTELIVDGYNGFLYELDNIEELANKMAVLIQDKKMCVKMGDQARANAIKTFLIERCVNEIECIYSKLVGVENV